jgi:hypothetical protein
MEPICLGCQFFSGAIMTDQNFHIQFSTFPKWFGVEKNVTEILPDLHLSVSFKTPPVFAILQPMAITRGCKESNWNGSLWIQES